jgi:signal peptidase II
MTRPARWPRQSPGWRSWAVPGGIIVLADQLSKLAVERLTDEGFRQVMIPGFFNLVHAKNTGIAFSMLADWDSAVLRPALIVFALAAISMVVWLLHSGKAGGRGARWGLTLVLGGAAGNLVDRILHGSVVDFLDFHLGGHHWPAFNLADSCITIGAVLVIADLLFAPRPHERAN